MESNPNIKTWTPATIVMVALIILGSGVAAYRLLFGLGAATNMNDGFPWGFWLGLDVLGGGGHGRRRFHHRLRRLSL